MINKFFLFIFLIFNLLLSNKDINSQNNLLLEKATTHYFNKEYEQAYQYSLKGLQISPKNPYFNFYIGDYYGFQGNAKEALKYLNIAIKNYDKGTFTLAHYQRAVAKMVLNLDLSYCEDIQIIKKSFKDDDTYIFLEQDHPEMFAVCYATYGMYPHELIDAANRLAEGEYCGYSLMLYNEASKNGTWKELSKYDKSKCPDMKSK